MHSKSKEFRETIGTDLISRAYGIDGTPAVVPPPGDGSLRPPVAVRLEDTEIPTIERVLPSLEHVGAIEDYNFFVKQATATYGELSNKDLLAIATWTYYTYGKNPDGQNEPLSRPPPPRFLRKPLCLLSPSEIDASKREIGLKAWGDTRAPYRHVPSEELIKKMDHEFSKSFDRLESIDLKDDSFLNASRDARIKWARAADSMYESTKQDHEDVSSCVYRAMEYGCKVSGIPTFEDEKASDIYILARIDKYKDGMTDEEVVAGLLMIEDSTPQESDSVEIENLSMEPGLILEKLLPTLADLQLKDFYDQAVKSAEVRHQVGRIVNPLDTRYRLNLAIYIITGGKKFLGFLPNKKFAVSRIQEGSHQEVIPELLMGLKDFRMWLAYKSRLEEINDQAKDPSETSEMEPRLDPSVKEPLSS